MPNTKQPKTYDDIAGTNRGTYEEALASRKVREGLDSTSARPDTPSGAAVHVNPALTPAPAWEAPKDRIPVPVINDPGVLGSAPSLADLNRAALTSYGVPETDPTSGITEESNQAEITEAAEARMDSLNDEVKQSVADAQADSKEASKPLPKPEPKPATN